LECDTLLGGEVSLGGEGEQERRGGKIISLGSIQKLKGAEREKTRHGRKQKDIQLKWTGRRLGFSFFESSRGRRREMKGRNWGRAKCLISALERRGGDVDNQIGLRGC